MIFRQWSKSLKEKKYEAICCNIESTEEKILYKLVKDFVQSFIIPICTLLLSLNPTRVDQEKNASVTDLAQRQLF